jgi:phosphoserine phosphatase
VTLGLEGRISYAEWFSEDLKMLKAAGATRTHVNEVAQLMQPQRGCLELLQRLGDAGIHRAVLSGGIDVVLEAALPQVQFDAVHINQLVFGPDGRLISGEPTPYDMQCKADGVRALCRRFGVSAEECAFVGNGANDVSVSDCVGLSIAFGPHAEPSFIEVANLRVSSPDLRALIDIFLPAA